MSGEELKAVLAKTHAFTIDGLQVRHVSVEVDVRPGLPAFTVVGLADTAVREARERIQAAIRNSGFRFPAGRITANLAPGDLPKAGAGLDLAIACALLAAAGECSCEPLARLALLGELALDGAVRPAYGALAVADAAGRCGIARLVLAGSGTREAQLVAGLDLAIVENLRGAVDALEGRAPERSPTRREGRRADRGGARATHPGADLADVRGQQHAVRALVIAAAGGHSALLSGPPGTGKTMLAHRIPSILPALSREEAIEVARINSLAGERVEGLPRTRPFRAPHHSITTAGLVGGAQRGRVGEIVRAHNGVLFLDELSEFARATLEALRQPLEDGRVAIVRARHSAVHPARFILLAATNPCPCGFAGEGERCACSEAELARHRRRLSGPLLDRMDLLVPLQRASAGLNAPVTTSSARARARVAEARDRQARRFVRERFAVNAHIDAGALARHARLDSDAEELLRRARAGALLSARGEQRVLRVARTIADLNEHQRIRANDLGGALAMRTQTMPGASRGVSGRRPPAHGACPQCLRRSWLLGQLGPSLDFLAPDRDRLHDALALSDPELIDSLAGRRRAELRERYARFDERTPECGPGVGTVCRHERRFPDILRAGPAPAMLHVDGTASRLCELACAPVVTLLGSTRPSDYGSEMAAGLARELSASGVTVASVLTDGVGAAAQLGAQLGHGASIAVLGSGLALASGPRLRPLRERLRGRGCVVSELPCGVSGRRWGEPAAERVAVTLASLVIVIESRDTPRELAGAALARALGRPLAALPGRVTSVLASGPHALVVEGARMIRDTHDVLDLLHATTSRRARGHRCTPGPRDRLPAPLDAVLELVGAGADTPDRLIAAGAEPDGLLLVLSELELVGLLSRGENGRYLPRHAAGHSHI